MTKPIRVPFNPGYVITDFQAMFGYDLSVHTMGMEFYNSNNRGGFLIDGTMSEAESHMDTRMDEWRAVVGPQGAMTTASVWDQGYKEQADNQSKENYT